MLSKLVAILLVGVLAGAVPGGVRGQNCSCGAAMCCSQWGYCGSGDEYCGSGCREGPCYSSGGGSRGGGGVNVNSVSDAVTEDFINGISNQANGSCPGRKFYSRDAYLKALSFYPQFGHNINGSADDSKREYAAFFAHVNHETGQFCNIEEIGGSSKDYCNKSSTQYPCVPGKGYYGRGPLQISWNYNYGPAGQSIGFDGLKNPETVATDPVVSFRTAFWFWMTYVHSVIGQGFGATIRAINGMECGGGDAAAVNSRVGYYKDYCNQFGVSPGNNLSC